MQTFFSGFAFALMATQALAELTKRDRAKGYGTRIVGGEYANTEEFPWFVELFNCGASLIAPNVVLSAAHCDPSASYLIDSYALVGAYHTWDDSRYGQFVQISDQKVHPNYDDWTVNNDFMLLKLSESVTTPVVEINKDPDNPNTSSGGTTLTVIGVGATSEGGWGSDILQKVDVDSVSDSQCQSLGLGITENMFCAGDLNGGKDSCQGDSGGPIFDQNNVQVGVVSWGFGCAQPNSPGVYATVSAVYDWIQEVVCDEWHANATFCDGDGGGGGDDEDEDDGDDEDDEDNGGDRSCQNNELEMKFTITTDDYGHETSWLVRDSNGGVIANGEGYGNGETHAKEKCLTKNQCYILILSDTYGDGLCCGSRIAGYKLEFDGSTIAEAYSQDFGDEISFQFGSCNGGGPAPTPELTQDPTQAPTAAPTGGKQYIACGRRGKCRHQYNTALADRSEKHFVRCCSDEPISGWHASCGIFTESNAWGQCSGKVSFAEAESICAAEGARLCTKEEVEDNCTRGTGCGYDWRMIWTSTSGGGGGDGGGDGGCLPLDLLVRTDSYAYEVTVKLINDVTEDYVWHDTNLKDNQDHSYSACIDPNGCHQLEVWDSWGDGLVDDGFVKVALNGNTEYEGGDYGYSLIKRFGNAC